MCNYYDRHSFDVSFYKTLSNEAKKYYIKHHVPKYYKKKKKYITVA